jgi:hypothetical protein
MLACGGAPRSSWRRASAPFSALPPSANVPSSAHTTFVRGASYTQLRMPGAHASVLVERLDGVIGLSGIHPGYSCKEGRIVEDGLLVEFPCTPTRTRSVYSY